MATQDEEAFEVQAADGHAAVEVQNARLEEERAAQEGLEGLQQEGGSVAGDVEALSHKIDGLDDLRALLLGVRLALI